MPSQSHASTVRPPRSQAGSTSSSSSSLLSHAPTTALTQTQPKLTLLRGGRRDARRGIRLRVRVSSSSVGPTTASSPRQPPPAPAKEQRRRRRGQAHHLVGQPRLAHVAVSLGARPGERRLGDPHRLRQARRRAGPPRGRALPPALQVVPRGRACLPPRRGAARLRHRQRPRRSQARPPRVRHALREGARRRGLRVPVWLWVRHRRGSALDGVLSL